jgi:uridine phosphorylase
VFSPAEAVSSLLRRTDLAIPEGVILAYQREIGDHLRACGARSVGGFPAPWRTMWMVERPGRPTVGVVCGFGIGAPAAAVVMEELIALGVGRFINMGTAGCLQPGVGFGEIVVCTGAVRDEGLSYHYLPAEKFVHPAEAMTAALRRALDRADLPHRTGMTWTIDAAFRETVAEAHSYQAEGVVTVEMEAAALFAVARYRDVEIASAFVISDQVLADVEWRHAFHSKSVLSASISLLEASLDALAQPS